MRRLLSLGLIAGLCACGGEDTKQPAASTGPAMAQGPAERSAAVAALAQQLAEPGPPRGTVLERLDASSYSYLRLRTAEGEMWAAVPQTDVAVGTEVAIVNGSRMDGFESQTLGRRFESILFGTLEGSAPAGSVDQLPPGHPQVGEAAAGAGPTEPIAVEKAAGADGRTIAEIYAQRTSLAGKSVSVRGQVVKFMPGIMGKNWLHLRDGSGTTATQDNDLTVTTASTVRVGEVVVATGLVSVDRDFGAGYLYSVIVEDAKVTATQRAGL